MSDRRSRSRSDRRQAVWSPDRWARAEQEQAELALARMHGLDSLDALLPAAPGAAPYGLRAPGAEHDAVLRALAARRAAVLGAPASPQPPSIPPDAAAGEAEMSLSLDLDLDFPPAAAAGSDGRSEADAAFAEAANIGAFPDLGPSLPDPSLSQLEGAPASAPLAGAWLTEQAYELAKLLPGRTHRNVPRPVRRPYAALRAEIDLPVTLPGKTASRLLLEPPAAGEFRPAAEINPRND